MAEATAPGPGQAAPPSATVEPSGPTVEEPVVADELLVEEISIDGMCGVY